VTDLRRLPDITALTAAEQKKLKVCEQQIRDGVAKATVAFESIRDQRLYRETHKSFDAYCRDVWGLTRRTIDRRISFEIEVAAAERDQLVSPPKNEHQARQRTTTPKTTAKIDGQVGAEVTDEEVANANDGDWTPVEPKVDPVFYINEAIRSLEVMFGVTLDAMLDARLNGREMLPPLTRDPLVIGLIDAAYERLGAAIGDAKLNAARAEKEVNRKLVKA
jgi:hypothetical protein